MTPVKKHYLTSYLVVIIIFIAIYISGCSHALKGAHVKPAEPGVWKTFEFRPGDQFKYAITDHTQSKQGWVAARVMQKDVNELEATWEGELGGQQFSFTTAAPADRLIGLSRAMLITSKPAVPFAATIISFWWDQVYGTQWAVGAKWSAVFQEMVPIGFTLEVTDHCEASGVSGFYGRVMSGSDIYGEVCVSPALPLPIWVLTRDNEGKPRYEAQLTEYTPLK